MTTSRFALTPDHERGAAFERCAIVGFLRRRGLTDLAQEVWDGVHRQWSGLPSEVEIVERRAELLSTLTTDPTTLDPAPTGEEWSDINALAHVGHVKVWAGGVVSLTEEADDAMVMEGARVLAAATVAR